jgi:hypothetical protein
MVFHSGLRAYAVAGAAATWIGLRPPTIPAATNVLASDTLSVQVDVGSWTPLNAVLNGVSVVSVYVDQALTPAALAGLKELRPSVLRFPAGTAANYYDWQTGTYSTGKPGDSWASGRRVLAMVPIGNFFALADTVGAQVDYIVNVYGDSPAKSAALARYIRDHGWSVAYWELANEPASRALGDRFPDPGSYLRIAAEHADSIASVFPTAQFAVGTQNRDFRNSNWNRAIAQQHRFQNVVVHRYVGPQRTQRRAMRAVGVDVPIGVAYSRLLRHSAPAAIATYAEAFPGKRLWVTEWGLLFFGQAIQNSLGHAIWMARTWVGYMRQPEIQMAAYWNFNGAPYEMMDGRTTEGTRRVTYYAFQMVSDLLRGASSTAAVGFRGVATDQGAIEAQVVQRRCSCKGSAGSMAGQS